MDMNRWKLVLFDWIKASGLIDVFGSLEHVQLNDFFFNFYHKIHTELEDSLEDKQIGDFLKEIYPDYETLYDETNNVSSQDYVYIFSLLLHYSCVREKNEFFQLACTKLNSTFQMCIAHFFEYITRQTIFNKETIRTGIKQTAISSSPQTSYFSDNSPKKTPRKTDLSPPTPSKDFINSKLKELKAVKSQLENERYERNMLEMEVKQSQEKVDNLVKKCKDLNHEVQSLKANSVIMNDSENFSPNKAQREYQIRRKMQKEIQQREDIILDLKYEIENGNATNKKYSEKINTMERQMNDMRLKIRELDASLDEVLCNMTIKDQQIQSLEEERRELLEFINETRSGANSKDVSSDCLDFSCSTALYTTTTSDLCESLAKSVVDVQLKEKENEIVRLNELLSTKEKIKTALELKILELNGTVESLENELNDVKSSKTKIFDEKSKEIQSLQNQVNSMVSKNKELQRDLDLKHKINLKMLQENDTHKDDAENLQEEVTQLKDQIAKYNLECKKLRNDLNLAQQIQSNDNNVRKEFSMIIRKKSLEFDEILKNINCKLYEKDEKLLKLTKLAEDLKKMHEANLKESQEKLMLKDNEITSLNSKFAELEEKLEKEKIYNDKLQDNIEIMKAKLQKSRDAEKEAAQKLEELRASTDEEKRKYFSKMDEKLKGYKAEMIEKYEKATAESKNIKEKVTKLENLIIMKDKQLEEKDGIVKKFDLLINKIQSENDAFRHEIEEKDKTIKSLTADLMQQKHEKEFIDSKLKFLEQNEGESSTPNVMSEQFDNMFETNLKNNEELDDLFSIGSSSEFLRRNSQYPPHLRDSYALCKLDKDVSEQEMKQGVAHSTFIELEPRPSEILRKQKASPNYHRPGPPTPSKNARLSITSNHKIALKDSTNTECVEKISTPSRIKAYFSSFGRSKDECRGYRVDKNNRTLTPRRHKNGKEKWKIEKDIDSDENVPKNARKEKELDRKEKRDKARDMNRPNLQDESLDITICSNDSEWTEDDENERHSSPFKQDKSLEYIKHLESYRKRQQKMRRRSFNNNRKSSISKGTKILGRISRISSNDWDKFQSCRSLQSDSSLPFNSTLHSPIKTCTRNYIESHFAEYNRMSDYLAPPPYRQLASDIVVDDDFWNFNLKDIKKPVPLIVIILLTICLVAVLIYFNRN